jgi:hypothetical protein
VLAKQRRKTNRNTMVVPPFGCRMLMMILPVGLRQPTTPAADSSRVARRQATAINLRVERGASGPKTCYRLLTILHLFSLLEGVEQSVLACVRSAGLYAWGMWSMAIIMYISYVRTYNTRDVRARVREERCMMMIFLGSSQRTSSQIFDGACCVASKWDTSP